jgi:cytochrome c oxidase subunit 4
MADAPSYTPHSQAGGGPSKPADAGAHAHPPYIGIFVALAVLTAIELGVAFLPWPKLTLILLLIGLAVWKALLVALYYMHLRFEPNRIRILAIAPIPLAFILVIAVIQEF